MTRPCAAWTPSILLALGVVFTMGVDLQQSLQLRVPLATALPAEVAGGKGVDARLSDAEVRVAGVTDYLIRNFEPADRSHGTLPFSVYVGYYDSQTQGKTIHSPKNCLPGSGWEALASTTVTIETAHGPVRVNRYLLQRENAQALVLYWYQGRSRVENNEYVVKWDLLRDAALRRRSEEALVRVVVPVGDDPDRSLGTATAAATALIPALFEALPD